MKQGHLATHIFGLSVLCSSISINACEMIMGYRTNERPPQIQKAPNNEGLYKDLYSTALSNIGCTLKVVRAPAKRIHQMLHKGEVDFYPTLGFSIDRQQSMYFIENGLILESLILTHKSVPQIKSLTELKDKVMLRSIGTMKTSVQEHKLFRFAFDLSVPTAVKAIGEGKAYYYQYDKTSLEYYLRHHPNDKVKLHYGLFGRDKAVLGFSKLSKHAQYNNGALNSLSKMDEFTRALQTLSTTKAFDDMLAKYGIYYPERLGSIPPTN